MALRGISKKLLAFLNQTGLIRFGRRVLKKSLTVINYHRIGRLEDAPDSFHPNISASPQGFDEQITYLAKWRQIVSLKEVTDWLHHNTPLPPYAALITFDDGYLDNYTNAIPILQKYNLPAVIYLTSGYISSNLPFYWDLACYCFNHTQKDFIRFPSHQEKRWESKAEKMQILHEWVESLKLLDESEKQKWVNSLPEVLGVTVPENQFKNTMLTWEHVREMHSMKIEFGAHTISHPILTRISLEQAQKEIIGSKQKIEEELKSPVTSFVYPNGTKNDFNGKIVNLVKESGFATAFTLLSGPTTLFEVKKAPHTIRRVFISNRHTLAHFSSLISPFNRLR